MTNLDEKLVQSLRQSARTFDRGGASYTLQATRARAGLVVADLEVVREGDVVGYITPYTDREHGAVRAGLFGQVLPRVVSTVEAALDEITA